MAHVGKESETRLCERYHFGIELVQLFVALGELLRELAFAILLFRIITTAAMRSTSNTPSRLMNSSCPLLYLWYLFT